MSAHGYEDKVGQTWRDLTLTREELTVQQIANYVKEKRVILSSTWWGRFKHRGRHHQPSIFQRAYTTLVMAWNPIYS